MDYKITLNQQELQIVYAALGELPMKVSINLFGKLQQEQQKQDKANAVPVESLDFGNCAPDSDIDRAINSNK